jgi:predicted acylesterase/phospholipase RssA
MGAKGNNGRLALVLSGGHALGAFQAGAFEALEAGGVRPDWVLGTSIGAVNGAILCGNGPKLRVERLRQFWAEVSGPDGRQPERCRCRRRAYWLGCAASFSGGRRCSFPIGC